MTEIPAEPVTWTESRASSTSRAYWNDAADAYRQGTEDERERASLVLVWRDERAAEICRSAPVALGTARIAIPLDAQHADLTGGDGD